LYVSLDILNKILYSNSINKINIDKRTLIKDGELNIKSNKYII